jgi:hypothetical protein
MRAPTRPALLALAVAAAALLMLNHGIDRWLGSAHTCSVFSTLIGASRASGGPIVSPLRHRPLDAPTLL